MMIRTLLISLSVAAFVSCLSTPKQSGSGQSNSQTTTPAETKDRQSDVQVQNPGELSLAAVNVIRRASGIFLYKYKETLDPIDPHKDYEVVRRVTNPQVIADLKQQLSENAGYKQQYVSRCFPVWDYGLEFRDGEQKKTFLFSFRCNTLKLVEDKLYRDFAPQRAALYALFNFEINERTSVEGKK